MANGYSKYGGLGGGGGGGSGTVTSVALADGSSTPIFTITGSPVTTSGTLTETLITQTANTVFAGPTTGAAAQPTFRAVVSADISGLFGNLTDAGTDGIVVTGGSGAVLGSGTSLAQHVADTTHNGYLSSTDWNTFNGKQAAGNYITALTGDVTASGPGSVAATLATVNSNVGSFGSSTSIPSFTVNGKGLITAASGNVVIAPAGTLTGTTLASNVVTSSLTSLGTQSVALNMGSHLINNLTDPSAAQDAATKNYVDTALAALNPAEACYAATPGSNIAGTYLNGVAGVGATFTTTATGTFTLDGTTPPINARILIKDQTSGFQNGIYNITTLGTIGVSTVFTRALDYNTASDMNSAGLVPIINGTLNALSSWQQTATITSVGTDALVFQEFTANPSLYLLKANNLSDVASKATSFNNLSPVTTTGDLIYSSSGATNTRLAIGSNGQFLGVSSGVPAWQSGTALGYSQAYFGSASSWAAASTTLVDGTNSGGNSLTVRTSANLTLTAAASNVCGITFTPANSSSVYLITAQIAIYNNDGPNSNFFAQLIDGSSTVISGSSGGFQFTAPVASPQSITMTGIYAPGTGSAVTVKVQIAGSSGTTTLGVNAGTTGGTQELPVEWTVRQIPSNIIGTPLSLAAFGSTANANGLSLSGGVLNMQPASSTQPGGVSTTTQTFAGAKTLGAAASEVQTIGATSSTALHRINGGMQRTTRTITNNLTVDTTTTDYIIFSNFSAGHTITLPTPTNGRILIIKDISGTAGTNNITIAPSSSEKIDGLAASYVYQTNWGSVMLTSDGTDWFII